MRLYYSGQYNGQSAAAASKQLEKLRNRASVDCRKFISDELDCEAAADKNSKFEHRINKVLSDAVWHLTGAKKCRAANEIGNWVVYRKRRDANDSAYYYNEGDYYTSDEYANYYESDEYDNSEYVESNIAQRSGVDSVSAGPGANKFLGNESPHHVTSVMISILLELDEGERSVETEDETENEFEEKGKNKTSPPLTLGEECEISIDMFFDHEGRMTHFNDSV